MTHSSPSSPSDARREGRVLVAMSGGVDSSVAAALLVEDGWEVFGVTLHLWDAEGEDKVGRCCSPEDQADARLTCDHLGIPHYVFDEREGFRREVVSPFVDAYLEGRTPSPCTACNQHVKLGRLHEIATRLGATHIATGHYARILHEPGGATRLLRGLDRTKDQSYFLYGVPEPLLARMLFPLGAMQKSHVRAEGRRLGVPNADKPDSQELCFVPDGDVAGFIERQRPRGEQPSSGRAGKLLSTTGEVVGRHDGVHHFTVGQRKGLGLGGGASRYVLRILPDTNDVVIGADAELFAQGLRAGRAAWIGARPGEPLRATVRIRYRHEAAPATVLPLGDDAFEARFDAPQRAITPGQIAVIYLGEQVIGGGVIVGGA